MRKAIAAVALAFGLMFVPQMGQAGEAKKQAIKTYKVDLKNKTRVVVIKGAIRMGMAEDIVRQVYDLSYESSAPIYYVINTFGGSLLAGNQIIRAMTSANASSICVVDGAAYSMGALILAQCNSAYIHKDASVMFHEGYLRVEGKLSEVFSYIGFEKQRFDALNKQTARLLKMSLKSYLAKQKNEMWLTARETVKMGLARGLLNKLEYEIPAVRRRGFFSIFGNTFEEMTPEDGVHDLIYIPLNQENPYLSQGRNGIIKGCQGVKRK